MNTIIHLADISQLKAILTQLDHRFHEHVRTSNASGKNSENTMGVETIQAITINVEDECCDPQILRLCLYMDSWWHENSFSQTDIKVDIEMEELSCRCKCHVKAYNQLAEKIDQIVQNTFKEFAELRIQIRQPY